MAQGKHFSRLTDDEVGAIARAIADPRRFAILEQISRAGSMNCSALAEHEEISAATISHHLRELQEAGLVEAEREGRGMKLSLRRGVWDAYLKRLGAL